MCLERWGLGKCDAYIISLHTYEYKYIYIISFFYLLLESYCIPQPPP